MPAVRRISAASFITVAMYKSTCISIVLRSGTIATDVPRA
jgi:hypothetical protein